MAQAQSGRDLILVPKGTLKQIKTMMALGLSELQIPWHKFQTQNNEAFRSDVLGPEWEISYFKDRLTLATTIRWRELTIKERKEKKWREIMSGIAEATEAQERTAKALRASNRDDVADALSRAIIRSIPEVKPDGN